MRIENCKSRMVLIVAAFAAAVAPVTLSAASGAAEQPFRYEDRRLGELKDQSDKFKFVRIKIAPMYPGACLGDSPCEPWSHDYP
ncbi:MAG TPA: hypothetical protein VLG74_09790, partial [Blastocatellia bacterium]|nr:hypothetical protein [Blastocatellia bacterium]